MDIRNILFGRASRIYFSLSDHVLASSSVSDFDTTSSVVSGTFKSNISLVDPTIQFSRTEKRLVEWGVSFTTKLALTQSKFHLYIRFHLLLPFQIIEGSGYGFHNNIRDVLFRKVVSGPCLQGSGQLFTRCPIFWQL